MRRNIIAALALLLWGAGLTAAAVAQQPMKLGVLNDQTGLYADLTGMGSVHAARMAVEDYGGKVLGRPIEVIFADHQNKPRHRRQPRAAMDRDRGRQPHPRHSQLGRGARRARGDAHARRR